MLILLAIINEVLKMKTADEVYVANITNEPAKIIKTNFYEQISQMTETFNLYESCRRKIEIKSLLKNTPFTHVNDYILLLFEDFTKEFNYNEKQKIENKSARFFWSLKHSFEFFNIFPNKENKVPPTHITITLSMIDGNASITKNNSKK